MSGLNENQKRRITATFKYTDDLLSESLNAMAPPRSRLFPRCTEDLSPREVRAIESRIEEIRERMGLLLRKLGIASPPPTLSASWVLKTSLAMLGIALEDLRPGRMKGYGELDPEAAGELERGVGEIQKLVDKLSAFLGETEREPRD